jgi:hypothetical protein
MRSHSEGQCPNCASQVVWWEDGFECSTCFYTSAMWAAFLVSRPNPFPMHTDSPALLKAGDSY